MSEIKLFKKPDIVLIALLVFLTCSLIWFLNGSASTGGTVTITRDGQFLASFPLNEDSVYEIVDNDGVLTNTLTITQGTAGIVYANCPDKYCQKHKRISRTNETIVCLPNKIVVEVKRQGQSKYDVIILNDAKLEPYARQALEVQDES